MKGVDTIAYFLDNACERGVVQPRKKRSRIQMGAANKHNTPVLIRYVIGVEYFKKNLGGDDVS